MNDIRRAPVHPGEILQTLFLDPLELSQNAIARELKVPPRRINEIVNGKRRITADTALRLARYFRVTPRYWMGLQADYDLDVAQDEIEDKINAEIKPCERRPA
jgi:addiction module HigA family antidote